MRAPALWLLLGLSAMTAQAQTPGRGAPSQTPAQPPGAKPGTASAEARADRREPASSTHTPALHVASLGGGLQDAQQATLFKPFTDQTGLVLHVEGWDGSLRTLQQRTAAGNDWDLVLMEDAPLRLACRQGLFIPDPLHRDPDLTAPDSAGTGCGVAAWRESIVLAWDRSRVDAAPTWAEFWDVARRPGKRGLKRDPRGTLEIALMADGVAPDDVYRTLQTPEGINRAFRKLDQLKPYIVWWQTAAEAVQIIESGAVLMTSAPSGEIATADRLGNRHFGTQWAQSLGDMLDWGVTRAASPEARGTARRLLDFIQQPGQQQAFSAAYLGQAAPATASPGTASPGTAAPGAAGGTPAPTAHRNDTLMLDEAFWATRLEPLDARFEAWIGSK